MRVVCPFCSATYEVPVPLIGAAARRLRCARCQQEWTVDPAAGPKAAGAPPAAALSRAEPVTEAASAGPDRAGPDPLGPMSRLIEAEVAATERPSGDSGSAPPNDIAQETAPRREEYDVLAARHVPPPRAGAKDGTLSADPRPRERTGRAGGEAARAGLAWFLSVAVLGLCIAAAFLWRADVMRIWPPSERVYVALGVR